VRTVFLLLLSNVFMTFAWYAHLKDMRATPWFLAVLVSWGIAFFEYMIQVPANRIGYGTFSLGQLKIMQEIITLAVFVPFAVLYMGATAETGLPLGRILSRRGGVFHIQELTLISPSPGAARHPLPHGEGNGTIPSP